MKKGMVVLSAALLAATFAGCSAKSTGSKVDVKNADSQVDGGDPSTWAPAENVEVPSPIIDVENKEEAEKKADFTFIAPETIEGYTTSYCVYDLQDIKMIEIRYQNDDNVISARKQPGNGNDISGDFTVYEETSELTVNDKKVTVKGSNGTINVVTWTDGSYDYALQSETGLSTETVTELVNQIG